MLGPLLPFEDDAALIGFIKSVENVQHGGLSRAVGSDDRQDLAGINLQTDIVQGLQTPKRDTDILCAEYGFFSFIHGVSPLSIGLGITDFEIGPHVGGTAIFIGGLYFHDHTVLSG